MRTWEWVLLWKGMVCDHIKRKNKTLKPKLVVRVNCSGYFPLEARKFGTLQTFSENSLVRCKYHITFGDLHQHTVGLGCFFFCQSRSRWVILAQFKRRTFNEVNLMLMNKILCPNWFALGLACEKFEVWTGPYLRWFDQLLFDHCCFHLLSPSFCWRQHPANLMILFNIEIYIFQPESENVFRCYILEA